MNNVSIIAVLCRDPEFRDLGNDKGVCSLRCAYSKKFNSRDGQKSEKTVFFDTQVFGKTAINCRQFLTKGSKIAISGELDYQEWSGRDGQKKTKLLISANKIDFIHSANQSAPSQRSSIERRGVSPDYNPTNNQYPMPPMEETQCDMTEDDMPF